MPVVELTTSVKVDGQTVNFPPVGAGIISTLAVDEWSVHTIEVADATTDGDIFLGGVTTASIVMIHSDQTITYETAASGTERTITANTGRIILWDDSITVLTVSNASGSTATLTVFIAGT